MITYEVGANALPERTYQRKTSHGDVFLIVAHGEGGWPPLWVFIKLDKQAPYVKSWAEALARTMAMGLRAGVDPALYIEQLDDIVDEPHWHNGVHIKSIPHAVSLMLQEYVSEYRPDRAMENGGHAEADGDSG